MEIDARRQLIAELDKSLLAHAAALGQKEGGPTIGDAYELQDMAERHYYLKVEHEFTAAEVEALLAFDDPLAVACACWEENDHEHSFPICELLEEINASQRFPLRSKELELVEAAKAAMKQEFAEYEAAVLRMSKENIIEKSANIAAMQEALDFIQYDYKFERGDAAAFLQMEKPLHFVASLWPAEVPILLDMDTLLSDELDTVKAYQKEENVAVQPEKPSLRGQLRAAVREANQRPPQEGRRQHKADPPIL